MYIEYSIQWQKNTHLFTTNIHKDRLYLGPKNNIKAFKITEIIQNVLCRHNGIKLEINNIDKSGKIPKHMEMKQYVSE